MAFITRSLLILTVLYGIVFVFADMVLLHGGVSLLWGVVFAFAVIGMQFAAAPWFIERVFTIWWDDPDLPAMPAAQREFVEALCREQGLPPIKLGIIESGTPNAFAFGRFRADARIVVTRGLLDILTPDETNAVLAHEVGHVAHYDFAVMAAAALAPLVLYQIYVWCRNLKNLRQVAFGAYLAYFAGQFLVLLLNRTREYHADHFSACVTKQPNQLSSALVKIAYGMVRSEGEYREAMKTSGAGQKTAQRQRTLGQAVSLLGIAAVNGNAAMGLGMDGGMGGGMANPEQASAIMRWDLLNPWARFYELNSTHPLTALRIKLLNRAAHDEHQTAEYPLPTAGEGRGVSYPRFAVEMIFWALPLLPLAALLLLMFLRRDLPAGVALVPHLYPMLFIALGVTWAARIMFRYQGTYKPESAATLLEDMDVSQMRPRAVELRGEVIGNGVPGAFWSPDLVLRDETGLMFLLYRSSIPLGRLWFGVGETSRYIHEQVTVKGWYRRGLRPYVEIASITAVTVKSTVAPGMVTLFGNRQQAGPAEFETLVNRSYSRWIQLALAAALTAGGAYFLQW